MADLRLATELEWQLFGASAEWLGRQSASRDLPGLATKALMAGLDGPTLRVLAGEWSGEPASTLGPMLIAALAELRWPPLTRAEAWRGLVAFHCWEVATGRVELSRGAQHVQAVTYGEDGQPEDADGVVIGFHCLDDELGGGWGRRAGEIDRAVAREANAVVTRFLEGRPIDGS